MQQDKTWCSSKVEPIRFRLAKSVAREALDVDSLLAVALNTLTIRLF
jgi:hypothetical protein